MGDSVYVYGIVEAESFELDVDGVEASSPIYTVTHGPLAAVVSDLASTDVERTDENVRAHDAVLREVLTGDGGRTVVPMQFGMAFASNRALVNVLRGARPSFRKALRAVDGSVELGVKVVTENGAAIDGDEVRGIADETFESVSIDSVANDRFSDRLILNRSYLVDRDEQDAFGAAVETFERQVDGVIVQYTGPWAPYNFVDIAVGTDRHP